MPCYVTRVNAREEAISVDSHISQNRYGLKVYATPFRNLLKVTKLQVAIAGPFGRLNKGKRDGIYSKRLLEISSGCQVCQLTLESQC